MDSKRSVSSPRLLLELIYAVMRVLAAENKHRSLLNLAMADRECHAVALSILAVGVPKMELSAEKGTDAAGFLGFVENYARGRGLRNLRELHLAPARDWDAVAIGRLLQHCSPLLEKLVLTTCCMEVTVPVWKAFNSMSPAPAAVELRLAELGELLANTQTVLPPEVRSVSVDLSNTVIPESVEAMIARSPALDEWHLVSPYTRELRLERYGAAAGKLRGTVLLPESGYVQYLQRTPGLRLDLLRLVAKRN